MWAMTNIEDVASAINVSEIRPAVNAVVERGGTPAHDLIGYFSQLDAAMELTKKERSKLAELLKKHDDAFVKRVLSIRDTALHEHASQQSPDRAVRVFTIAGKIRPPNAG